MLSHINNQSESIGDTDISKDICNSDPAWGLWVSKPLCQLLTRVGSLTASPFFLGSLCYCKHPWLEAVRCSEELSVGCLQRQAATVVPGCASPLKHCRFVPLGSVPPLSIVLPSFLRSHYNKNSDHFSFFKTNGTTHVLSLLEFVSWDPFKNKVVKSNKIRPCSCSLH